MKLLLDENLDWRLRRDCGENTIAASRATCAALGLPEESVPLLGWAGMENSALLKRAEQDQFEVFITMDTNLPFQQDLRKFNIAVIALHAPTNRLADTRPLMPKVLKALQSVRPGTLTVIS